MSGQPKLFGGSLEEYLEATNQDIPLIMKSCFRVINLYGKISVVTYLYFYDTVHLQVCTIKVFLEYRDLK